jgi:hypothetical protein
MKTLTLATFVVLPLIVATPIGAQTVSPPAVPANLAVPADKTAFLVGHAYGTQNYSCLPSGKSVAWTLYGPQATLFDAAGGQLITHFLSPNPDENGVPRATWQHSKDTSAVWAVATASSTDPDYVAPGAIAWLRLEVVGAQTGPLGGDRLVEATHIHRVTTAGGVAPSAGCKNSNDIGKKALVPYTTDYIFYR